jgi:hypothetical protein
MQMFLCGEEPLMAIGPSGQFKIGRYFLGYEENYC